MIVTNYNSDHHYHYIYPSGLLPVPLSLYSVQNTSHNIINTVRLKLSECRYNSFYKDFIIRHLSELVYTDNYRTQSACLYNIIGSDDRMFDMDEIADTILSMIKLNYESCVDQFNSSLQEDLSYRDTRVSNRFSLIFIKGSSLKNGVNIEEDISFLILELLDDVESLLLNMNYIKLGYPLDYIPDDQTPYSSKLVSYYQIQFAYLDVFHCIYDTMTNPDYDIIYTIGDSESKMIDVSVKSLFAILNNRISQSLRQISKNYNVKKSPSYIDRKEGLELAINDFNPSELLAQAT